ncbi:glycine/betaine/sarcosine/D-proline family reductase selenoprotein B [Polynucleobacter sp. AP-Reno-20A-A9]|uniref:glycine/betaine/sarcosine/D-proline family reductase selenoprotein B n=1 Tax=Polynucleobacter sp. AP-Reno-20A-A9 TaxID=2576925 RepID=UPI001C0AD862|nr:glycine/betaine/sarcosine/D-proline family reductase selenoprotein B [Polynucleobacter sp. AP-Reno-20A-A9]MBU3627522.1 glycine reductase [Polynucleobacter sp. AP-Reno-20A-A9]
MSKTSELVFAPEQDQPIRYIERTRSYYLGLGYENPYVWAHYIDVPFSPLKKPLGQSVLGLITTAVPHDPGKGPQGQGAPYNAAAKFYQPYQQSIEGSVDLRIAHVGVDRKNANMEDIHCWFPLDAAKRAVAAGRMGGLSANFYGLPTNRSQRHTLEIDAPRILEMLKTDGVDMVVLIPNCPICHQSQSLLARYLEAAGISTVVMGAAKDIIEYCGVPRLLFSDFPLGNAAAKPNDTPSQDLNFELALRLLELAPAPRTTVQSPLRWSSDPSWKLDYSNLEKLSPQEIARLREEAEQVRITARELRVNTLGA